jgi:hypothetical protein
MMNRGRNLFLPLEDCPWAAGTLSARVQRPETLRPSTHRRAFGILMLVTLSLDHAMSESM